MVKLADAEAPKITELASKDGVKKAGSLVGVAAVAAAAIGIGIPLGLGVAAWVVGSVRNAANRGLDLFANLPGGAA